MAGTRKPQIPGRRRLYNIGAPEVTNHTISCDMCHKVVVHAVLKVGELIKCECGRQFDCVWYRPVSDAQELQAYVDGAKSAGVATAYDFETDGNDTVGNSPFLRNLVGVSFCRRDQRGVAIYVPMRHLIGKNLDEEVVAEICAPFLRDHPCLVHGAAFMEWVWTYVKWHVDPKIIVDTCITMFLDDPNRVGRMDARNLKLKGLAKEIWDIDVTKLENLIDLKTQNFSLVPVAQAYAYGCQDSDLTVMLDAAFTPKVMAEQATIFRLETSLIPAIAKMHLRGIKLNPVLLQEGALVLDKEIEELEQQVFKEMGYQVNVGADGQWERPFDLGSPKKVSEQLFMKMGLPYDQRSVGASGVPSSSSDALEDLKADFPVVECLLDWRGATHMRDNFIAALPNYINPVTGYIHGSFNQCGAPTGRFSCASPNTQQIPKIRD